MHATAADVRAAHREGPSSAALRAMVLDRTCSDCGRYRDPLLDTVKHTAGGGLLPVCEACYWRGTRRWTRLVVVPDPDQTVDELLRQGHEIAAAHMATRQETGR